MCHVSCPREWDAQHAPSTSAARLPAGHRLPSLPSAPTKPPTIVIAHCLAQAFGRTGALDLDALRSLRAQVAERTTWPSWSWLPNTIFVQNLLATNGIDIGQTNDAELEKYCRLAAAMTTVVNWLPGRTVVYYDTTLLESLASTPIEQPIPAQALYRLPAWGLYLDLPWLAPGAGVFACLDPGPDLHTTHVLLTYTGVLADGVPLEHELLLANDMVPDSLSPPFAEQSGDVAHFVPDELSSVVGMPWGRVLATTVSMLLYLCSEGPDVRRVALPPGPGAPARRSEQYTGPTSRLASRRSPQGRPALSRRDAWRRDRPTRFAPFAPVPLAPFLVWAAQ